MKKYELFKVLAIIFLLLIILTWIIPVGSFDTNGFIIGNQKPIGLFDIGRIPLITIANLLQYGIVIAVIGGFYGVLNKTGAYSNIVEKVVSKFLGKETLFIIITTCILVLLSCLIGVFSLFLLISPFIISILMRLGFDKKIVLLSTFGAVIIGNMTSIYGSEIIYYIRTNFYIGINNDIFTKIMFLIMITFLLVIFIFGKIKLNNNEVIPLYEIKKTNRKILPLIVIFSIMVIFLTISMINWDGVYGINIFKDAYNNLMTEKINNYPLLSNIFGTINVFGHWNNYDFCVFLLLNTLVIGFIYSIKLDEIIENFKNGIIAVLKPALYATICSILFVALYNISSNENIYFTISNFLLTLFKGSKIVMMPLVAFIGGFFYTDFSNLSYVISTMSEALITDTTKYFLVTFMLQTMYGLSKLILPTSILLITGLSYLNISYKKWLKFIFKFVLVLMIICIAFFVVINYFL